MFNKKPRTPERAHDTQVILSRIQERADEKRMSQLTIETSPIDIVAENAPSFGDHIEYLLGAIYKDFYAHRAKSTGRYDPFESGALIEESARVHFDALTSEERVIANSLFKDFIADLEASVNDTVRTPRRIGRHATSEMILDQGTGAHVPASNPSRTR